MLLSSARQVYKPVNAIRLNYNASNQCFLSGTLSGSRNLWSLDFWHKRDRTGIAQGLWASGDYSGGNANSADYAYFNASDQLEVYINGLLRLRTDFAFRDTTSWTHFLFTFDAANADPHKRLRVYVNGIEVAAFSQAARGGIAIIQARTFNSYGVYLGYAPYVAWGGGYFAHVRAIGGRACTVDETGLTYGPSSLTVPDGWFPVKWNGNFGGGVWYDFSDASTTTTLAYDRTTNANHGSLVNCTVGTKDTCVVADVPVAYSDGGNGRGNYAVLADNGNQRFGALDLANNVTGYGTIPCTLYNSYWEVTAHTANCSAGAYNTETNTASTTQAITSGQTYGFRWDGTNLAYTTNGTTWNTIQAISGAGWVPYLTNTYGTPTAQAMSVNFGQRPFAYSMPNGYSTLCALNVTPAITDPREGFQSVQRTGTGLTVADTLKMSAAHIAWIKARTSALAHANFDNMQGTGKYYSINQGSGNPQVTDAQSITSLNSPIGIGTAAIVNTAGVAYTDLFWRASSTYGASTAQWTGDGTANRTISHGLSANPEFAIVFNLTDGGTFMWSAGNTGQTYFQTPDLAAVESNTSSPWGTGQFNSNVSFMVSNGANTNGKAYVGYLFRSVAGYSRVVPYTGSGATPRFLWTGFRPKFVAIIRHTGASASHLTVNGDIDWASAVQTFQCIDTGAAETTAGTFGLRFSANGVTITNTDGNANGSKYTLLAFAECPFAYANAHIGAAKLRATVKYGANGDSGPTYDFTFTSDTNDVNLRSMANALGYESALGPATVTVTVNSGVVIGSTASGTPAMDTGTWPAGTTITITNNGKIIGKGGDGGAFSGNGGNGGTGFKAQFTVTMTNNGWIAGGGGGGGGANVTDTGYGYVAYSGGGGGAGSNSAAGPVQYWWGVNWAAIAVNATAGGLAGTGGNGGYYSGTSAGAAPGGGIGVAGTAGSGAYGNHGSGGGGGGFGAAGGAGYNGTTGGAAGKAVEGNSNISWAVTGTRYGAIT